MQPTNPTLPYPTLPYSTTTQPHLILLSAQALFCYVVLNIGCDTVETAELVQLVRKHIGPFAKPERVVVIPGLPKTRSGKCMRRILRKIAEGTTDLTKIGDMSTLADSSIPDKILKCVLDSA